MIKKVALALPRAWFQPFLRFWVEEVVEGTVTTTTTFQPFLRFW